MEYITLTSEIRKYFGITSCHICFNNNDIMVMLQEMSDEGVIFACSFDGIKNNDEILIVFPSLFGKCEIKAEVISVNIQSFFIIECKILDRNKNEFFIEFENYIKNLINQKKRKEERILCNEKNLEKLRLNGILMLNYKYRSFRGVIKDVSYSGIKVLTNIAFLQSKDELFSFSLKFLNPEEKYFFVNCPVVRKQIFTFNNYDFAEIVFKLGENINYRKRLDAFFREEKKTIKR